MVCDGFVNSSVQPAQTVQGATPRTSIVAIWNIGSPNSADVQAILDSNGTMIITGTGETKMERGTSPKVYYSLTVTETDTQPPVVTAVRVNGVNVAITATDNLDSITYGISKTNDFNSVSNRRLYQMSA